MLHASLDILGLQTLSAGSTQRLMADEDHIACRQACMACDKAILAPDVGSTSVVFPGWILPASSAPLIMLYPILFIQAIF